MDDHASACSTYKQNMKAIGHFLDDVDATDEDHEEYVRGLIMKYLFDAEEFEAKLARKSIDVNENTVKLLC